MPKKDTAPNPKATKCRDCGAEIPSKYALKAHRWTCPGVKP